jgi:hypothetical protein
LVAVTAVPDWVMVAFQVFTNAWLPPHVQVTVQVLVDTVPVLVTVTVAVKPLAHWLSTCIDAEQTAGPAVPDGDGVADGRAVAVAEAVAVAVAEGRTVAVGVAEVLGVGEAERVGVAEVLGVGEAERVGVAGVVAVAEVVGVGDAVPPIGSNEVDLIGVR